MSRFYEMEMQVSINEKETHDSIVRAIRKIIPDCSVLTRWTCLENLPYEEYID